MRRRSGESMPWFASAARRSSGRRWWRCSPLSTPGSSASAPSISCWRRRGTERSWTLSLPNSRPTGSRSRHEPILYVCGDSPRRIDLKWPGRSRPSRLKKERGEEMAQVYYDNDADLISILLPDQYHKPVFNESIRPNMGAGKLLMLAHGFSIHFGQIEPPAEI